MFVVNVEGKKAGICIFRLVFFKNSNYVGIILLCCRYLTMVVCMGGLLGLRHQDYLLWPKIATRRTLQKQKAVMLNGEQIFFINS